jgi:hypothetical protein
VATDDLDNDDQGEPGNEELRSKPPPGDAAAHNIRYRDLNTAVIQP